MLLSRLSSSVCPVVLAALGLLPLPAQAQIIPDQTLGAEASSVVNDQQIRGDNAELIEDGATRGDNLFHSFSEFNVKSGQRVYFFNPVGIESILSRVTGENPSAINGTLGVDGPASLFLINPNGLVFGEAAVLDVSGSFYGTTAEAVTIGNGVFSAVAPDQSQLLAVSPGTSFWNYLTDTSGNVVNRGALAIGGDLVLAGHRLELQGQVAALGDVSLLATDTIQIRDTAETPFIGFAGGNLLVQGNQQVDIVALSRPESGLFSYGDLVLRSADQVGGDTYYVSGGDFRIEYLDGSDGKLFSPIDPIIRALGDVTIGTYEGSSLHILAGGSVVIGTAEIIASEGTDLDIDFLRETVILSDGTVVEIDGSAQQTLDIRAGMQPDAIGSPPLDLITGFDLLLDIFSNDSAAGQVPTSADVMVGDVLLFPAINGVVLITNQYQPNLELPEGNIVITGDGALGLGIVAQNPNGIGGAVYVDARNNISILNSVISTAAAADVKSIVLVADETVTFDGMGGERLTGAFNLLIDPNGTGTGGDIRITARNLQVLEGAQLNTITSGVDSTAGSIILDIEETVRFEGSNPRNGLTSGAFSSIGADGTGTGGDVRIMARNLQVLDGAQLSATTFGDGNAGNVILDIEETAQFEGRAPILGSFSGAFSSIGPDGAGRGGDVRITARNLQVLDGAQLDASTLGNGNAGSVILDIEETARFVGSDPIDGSFSGAFSSVVNGALGQGGDVRIMARNLQVLDGAQLDASTSGNGNAGSVILDIEEVALFQGSDSINGSSSGAFSSVEFSGTGAGGNVRITARNLQVLNGAQLTAGVLGEGNAGSVILDVEETALFKGSDPTGESLSGASSSIGSDAVGIGGDVRIMARNLQVLDGAQLGSGTFGDGPAGDLILNIGETAHFEGRSLLNGNPSGAFSSIGPNGVGTGGDVRIMARNLQVLDGAQLSAGIFGKGNAGDVILHIDEMALFEGGDLSDGSRSGAFTSITPSGTGEGGDIRLEATDIVINDGAFLLAASSGQGNAGDILLTIHHHLTVTNGTISTNAEQDAGGKIQIDAESVFLFGDGDLQTFVNSGENNGGDIAIQANALVAFDDSDILAFSVDGRGGDVDLSQTAFFGQDFSFAPPGTDPRTLEGNDRVDINATGRLASGTISLADVSFIQDSLTELPDNLVNPEALVANSCIARRRDTDSNLVITGSDGLPVQPNRLQASYELGEIRSFTEPSSAEAHSPITEPHSTYRLADGRLVLGRECEPDH